MVRRTNIQFPADAEPSRQWRFRRGWWGASGAFALLLGAGLATRSPEQDWSRPLEVWSGGIAAGGDTLQIDFSPDLVAGVGVAYAVGTIAAPMARSTPEPLLARQIGGAGVGSPDGGRMFVHPRAMLDGAGTLHMLWGEPQPSYAAADAPGRPGRPALNRLMYARYTGGEWSAAETVYTGQLLWHAGNNSELLIDGDGRVHVAFMAVRPGAGPVLVHLRSSPAGWRATEIGRNSTVGSGSARGGAYPRLALGNGGRVYLAFVAAVRTASGPQVPNANSVFLMRSDDGGTSWDVPTLVSYSGQNQATDPQLVSSGRDTLHLLWGKNLHGGLWAEVVWHATSTDGGHTWTAPAELRVAGEGKQLQGLRAVVDPSRQVHLVLRVSGQGFTDHPQAGIYHATWRGAWTEPRRLDFAALAGGFDFAADPGGRLHLLWQTIDARGLRRLLYAAHPPCSDAPCAVTATSSRLSADSAS